MPKIPEPSDPSATVDESDTAELRVRTGSMPQLGSDTTGPTPALVPFDETTGPTTALLPTYPVTAPHDVIEARTEATMVDLPPAGERPPAPAPPPAEPRRSKLDHPVIEARRSKIDHPAIEARRSKVDHPAVEVRRSRLDHPALEPRRPSKATDPVAAPVELSLVDVSEESTNPVRRQLEAAELANRSTVTKEEPDPASVWRAWLASPASRGWRIGGGLTVGAFAALMLAILFAPAPPPNRAPPPRRIQRPEPESPRPAQPNTFVQAVTPQAPIFVDVEVDAGSGTVRVEKREAGVVKLITFPPTEVSVGGRALGPTPVYLSAPVGRVEVLLESRDAGIYKPVVVTLYPGQNPPRSWDLGRGWLEVVAPAGSQVSIDGRVVGTAPTAQLSLFEGFHRVDVVRPDKTRATSRVEVVPSFTVTHEVPAR